MLPGSTRPQRNSVGTLHDAFPLHDLFLVEFLNTATLLIICSMQHYRNFGTEMPKRGVSLGFEELSPLKISEDLLGNLTAGDKVAITSRFVNDAVDEIVHSLRSRDVQVRVITNQSAEEDFCFLKMAKKELVGIAKSTYVRWAGILGDADLVRLYIVDSPVTRAKGHTVKTPINLADNPNLERIRFELIKSEEMDNVDDG
jgi:hypothetical protein